MTTFTMNKAAASILNGSKLVRVRVQDGVVEIRPTNRTKGLSNLKKTSDAVVAVSAHGREGARFSVPEILEGLAHVEQGKSGVEKGKYGWIRLVAATATRGPLVTIS